VPFTVVDYMNLTNTRDLGNLAGNTIHKFTTPTNEEGFVKFVSAGIPYSGNNIIAANGPNDYNNYNLQHYELVSGGVCQCDFDVEFTY
jgi:hypothetical protein